MGNGVVSKLIVLAAVLAAAPPAAAETRIPTNGFEPGDGPAEYRCPAGQTLVGFAGRSGVWVDAVQAVCAPLLTGNVTGGSEPQGAFYGGPGGGLQNAHCPVGFIMEDVGMSFTYQQKQLASMHLSCRNLATGRTDISPVFGNPGYKASDGEGVFVRDDKLVAPNYPQRCPAGELPIGFYGRVGRAVNQLGLICDRVAAAPPQPPPMAGQKPVHNAALGVGSPAPPPAGQKPVHNASQGINTRAPPTMGQKPPTGGGGYALAPRSAITGVWQTVTDSNTHYQVTLIGQGPGVDNVGADAPILVNGTFVNSDGAHQFDGVLQGIIQPNTRMLIYNYQQKNGITGSGVFNLSPDGKQIAGDGNTRDKQHFVWTGSRAP